MNTSFFYGANSIALCGLTSKMFNVLVRRNQATLLQGSFSSTTGDHHQHELQV